MLLPMLAVLALVSADVSHPSGRLQGRDLDVLFEIYIGVRGRIPATVSVDYCTQLDGIWDRKDRRANGVSDKTGNKLVREYCRASKDGELIRPTLVQHIAHVGAVVAHTRQNMDWEKFAKLYGLNQSKLAVVRTIANQLDGRRMLAYSLTELMPSMDGKDNVAVTDYLLRNAGTGYLESLPALYDPYTSFGPYQFTAFAWHDHKRDVRGGSKANAALPDGIRISHGSVTKLRGDEHHRAAFLFALHNLANTIRRLNPRQTAMLQSVAGSKTDEIVQYIATAHHMPSKADNALERWLDNRCRKPFAISCGPHLGRYARKTASNLLALQ